MERQEDSSQIMVTHIDQTWEISASGNSNVLERTRSAALSALRGLLIPNASPALSQLVS